MLQRLSAEIQQTKADLTAGRETARVLIGTTFFALIATIAYFASTT
jgi:hypothetical protein